MHNKVQNALHRMMPLPHIAVVWNSYTTDNLLTYEKHLIVFNSNFYMLNI